MPITTELDRSKIFNFTGTHSWTEDLPICRESGVGYACNQMYSQDNHMWPEHPFEEICLHSGSSEDSSVFLYGVFDGHEGIQAAEFTMQGLAAELLLGQLAGKTKDQEIKEAFSQAFLSVEKNYLESLDDKVAQRTSCLFDIPEGLNQFEAYQKCPNVFESIRKLNSVLSCGTTAVVALVIGKRLYIANVGDSRALLCKTDSHGVHRVLQVSVDHDLSNEDELLRLDTLGIKPDKGIKRLGNQDNTRCIGNYLVKGAFREFEELASASEEPVIAEPEIQGGIELDDSCRFLLLMSKGLYKSLEEATGTTQVNKDIVQMAVAEFREQTTLTGVAQAVVDKVVRKHTDMSMSGVKPELIKRDDISLLVRNFNFPMPHATPPMHFKDTLQTMSDTNSSSTCQTRTNPPTEIKSYIDFSEFYKKVGEAKANGTLPKELYF
ncbi:TGF-beta-activated kinase 1 and MAP3K7-binding protein 1-like [Cimex lectularius]|uniref:PPM-type phosphatase domain-containing protein n=1 Tax=Cimex lectularius TaxID=79782 RepID=A0A8I6TGN1_CIMLE|nr:TGF-beta-activated kinase 1 and MAP3K7-binding protein 1-like [Cimex lectularius]